MPILQPYCCRGSSDYFKIKKEIHEIRSIFYQHQRKGPYRVQTILRKPRLYCFCRGMEQNYLIMKNENALIGLFQGMFEGNLLTFNPGWDENARNIDPFDDVRAIQQHLKSKHISLASEANEATSGPASIMFTDPDGNVILIDQHR